MELNDAIKLIEHDRINDLDGPQTWADLGCGDGLFAKAISYLLKSGSIIYAIDKAKPRSITGQNGITILTQQVDFIEDDLGVPMLDGIVMANSLHYVRDKEALLTKLEHSMKAGSVFIIVEYDTDVPVPGWVPYPVSFHSLKKFFSESGYKFIDPIGEQRSVYGRANLYSALVRKY